MVTIALLEGKALRHMAVSSLAESSSRAALHQRATGRGTMPSAQPCWAVGIAGDGLKRKASTEASKKQEKSLASCSGLMWHSFGSRGPYGWLL